MNILISVNKPYLLYAKVMLKSLAMNNNVDNLNIYLLYSNLSQRNINNFNKFCRKECNSRLHPILVDSDLFKDMPTPGWFSIEMYYRIIAPFILPEDLERILWIDADVIVQHDIKDLYNHPMGNTSIGAVEDMGDKGLINSIRDRLHLKSKYFNSGVILFNLNSFKQKWGG